MTVHQSAHMQTCHQWRRRRINKKNRPKLNSLIQSRWSVQPVKLRRAALKLAELRRSNN
jgi:hypothetical protein